MVQLVSIQRFQGPSRTVRDWGHQATKNDRGQSALGACKGHARTNGAAGAMRSDGSYILFYVDNGKLRQKTLPEVSIVVGEG